MNIKSRINARKIVLSYIYQHCFFDNIKNQEKLLIDSLFIDNIFQTDNETFEIAKSKLQKDINEYFKSNIDQETLKEFVNVFFDERSDEDIDWQYVFDITKNFQKYILDIQKLVNKYSQSFEFEQMDIIDKSLFILGYTEWKVIGTVKEIIINELIELAKRYSDDGAPKLLNGIMHKILSL